MNISGPISGTVYQNAVSSYVQGDYPKSYQAVTDAVVHEYREWELPISQETNLKNLRKVEGSLLDGD